MKSTLRNVFVICIALGLYMIAAPFSVRGDGWDGNEVDYRSACRESSPPDYRGSYFSFRLALSPEALTTQNQSSKQPQSDPAQPQRQNAPDSGKEPLDIGSILPQTMPSSKPPAVPASPQAKEQAKPQPGSSRPEILGEWTQTDRGKVIAHKKFYMEEGVLKIRYLWLDKGYVRGTYGAVADHGNGEYSFTETYPWGVGKHRIRQLNKNTIKGAQAGRDVVTDYTMTRRKN